MFKVIRELFGRQLEQLRGGSVYEVSAHGALFRALKHHATTAGYSFTGSELLDGWTPGMTYNGIRCENLEELTFSDGSFDLITSTGLMEHVENDSTAYAEIRRVLKPGGCYVFTIPYFPSQPRTLIRARRRHDGSIEHLEVPEYHADPFRGYRVFTWRCYGRDILHTLEAAGLNGTVRNVPVAGWTGEFPVIVAQRM